MAKPFDRPITIQKINELTEDWEDVFKPHARLNKAKSDNEYLSAGAVQGKKNLTFEVRYFKELEDIDLNKQLYRIVYKGVNSLKYRRKRRFCIRCIETRGNALNSQD